MPFSKGRLTAITRPGSEVAYRYDRYGRLLQDGALTFTYDENGNRVEVGYPDGVVARYGFDFADRESTLEIQEGSGPVQPLVTGAAYLPSGPLAQLTLGNGLVETRTFDPSYRPESIVIPGRLEQIYTTDAEGNIHTIDRAVGQARFLSTFDYQDPQYFLTRGDGPWGHQAWTYDRIGNRLTDAWSSYSYTPNPTGGHTPKLSRLELAPDGEPESFLTYGFDAAGNQTTVSRSGPEGAGRVSSLEYSVESRLSRMSTSDGTAATELLYDGRGYLRRSRLTFSNSTDFEQTEPTYSSEGLLYSQGNQRQVTRERDGDEGSSWTAEVSEHTTYLFYFAGRPVAQWRRGSADELLHLTTDHLGTPLLATDAVGDRAWEGGLEPFGVPYLLPCGQVLGEDGDSEVGSEGSCTPSRTMKEAGIYLRFPGQWDDSSFQSHGSGGDLYYNVHRWYEMKSGRYTSPDPFSSGHDARQLAFSYATSNPVLKIDPLGLITVRCESCKEIADFMGRMTRVLNNLRATGSVTVGSERFEMIAGTGCRNTESGPAPVTKHFKFPFSTHPCIYTCIAEHERVHRSQCRRLGVRGYYELPERESEIPAYEKAIMCLALALRNGSVELTREGVRY